MASAVSIAMTTVSTRGMSMDSFCIKVSVSVTFRVKVGLG
jgi:hypothetical protein